MQGTLKKLLSSLDDANQVVYQLPVGEQLLALNPLIGKTLKLTLSLIPI